MSMDRYRYDGLYVVEQVKLSANDDSTLLTQLLGMDGDWTRGLPSLQICVQGLCIVEPRITELTILAEVAWSATSSEAGSGID